MGADTGGDTAQPGQGPSGPAALGAGPGPRAELSAVPHSGEAASAGGRCQQALAGSELRSDSRHRCPCFNSSAMEPGRPGGGGGGSAAPGAAGTVASPARPGRGSGDRRDPSFPHGGRLPGLPVAQNRSQPPPSGPPHPSLSPTSLPTPEQPPAPGAGPPPQRGERRAPGASGFLWYLQFWQKSVFNLAVHIKIRTV